MEALINLSLLCSTLNDTEFKELCNTMLHSRTFMMRFLFKLFVDEFKSDQHEFLDDIHDIAQNIIDQRPKSVKSPATPIDTLNNENNIKPPLNIKDLAPCLINECGSYLDLNNTISFKKCCRYFYKSTSFTVLTNPSWFNKYKTNYGDLQQHHQLNKLKFRNVRKLTLTSTDFDEKYEFKCLPDLDEFNIVIPSHTYFKLSKLKDSISNAIQSINIKHLSFSLKAYRLCDSYKSDYFPSLWCSNTNIQYLSLNGFNTGYTRHPEIFSNWNFDCFSALKELKGIYISNCDDFISDSILPKYQLQSIATDSLNFNVKHINTNTLQKLQCIWFEDLKQLQCLQLQCLQLLSPSRWTYSITNIDKESYFITLIKCLENTKFITNFKLELPSISIWKMTYIIQIANILAGNVGKDFVLSFRCEAFKEKRSELENVINTLKQQYNVFSMITERKNKYIYAKIVVCNKNNTI